MRYWWIYTIFLTSIWACNNEASELGSTMVESSTRTILIDTCTVTLTTVKIDSLVTSGKNIIYTGHFDSELRGSVSAKSYISFLTPTYTEYRKNRTTPLKLDSFVLEMKYSPNFYGDTLNRQTLALHMLNEGLVLPKSGSFYNTSKVDYNDVPITNIHYIPRPKRGEPLRVSLPDSIGEEFLAKMANGDDEFSSNERFLRYFPGFAIVPDDPNSVILGFLVADTSAIIKLYYHFVEEEKKEYSVTISPNISTNFFSIYHDRSGSPLQELEDGYSGLSSSHSNNMAYLFGSIGYYTRIEFPYLNDLLKIGNAGGIISAELLLYPVLNSYNNQFPLPEQLHLYIADDTNANVDAITNSYGTDLQAGNLIKDDLFNKNTHYHFTITSFIREQLPALGINKKKLHLVIPDSEMNKTLNSVVIGDHQHPDQQIKVNLIYSLYE